MPLSGGLYFDSFTLFFWFDLFLETRAEILEKFLFVFWEIWRHKEHFEIKWDFVAFLEYLNLATSYIKKKIGLLTFGFLVTV